MFDKTVVIQMIVKEFEYNARCTQYNIIIIIIKLHKSIKLVVTSYLIQTTPDAAIYPSTPPHIIQCPYPGVTGCSLEGDGSMAFYECESTTTTAEVQQHE